MKISLATLAIVMILTALGCDAITGASNITYRITGTATRVSVTYEAEGGTEQIASISLFPWTYSRRAERGDFLYVSAQIVGGTGSVTVTIDKGGSVFKTATSSGFASIATASGILD